MSEKTLPIAVRIPVSLHDRAGYISRILGVPVRVFVEAGLTNELDRIEQEGGEAMRVLIQDLKDFDAVPRSKPRKTS